MLFLSSADFLKNYFFEKNSFRNTIRMSNSLDPDQARRFVGLDLGPNCLPRLSADDTGRQRVKFFLQIAELPESFSKLSKLKTLDLFSNRLREIPTVLRDLTSLVRLDVEAVRIII